MKRIRLGLVAIVFAAVATACDAASITSASECTPPTMGSDIRHCG